MYKFSRVSDSEFSAFNNFIGDFPHGNFRQTTHWGEIKKASGWNYACYALKYNDAFVATALILIRNIIKLPFSLLYCCRGPVVDWSNSDHVAALFDGLKDVVMQHNGLCLRFDPEPASIFTGVEECLFNHGVVKLPDRVTTWNRALYSTRVLLNESEDQLFKNMRRTHRQNINKSIKSGVSVGTDASPGDKDIFFNLICGLELRRNSLIHSKDYYDSIYNNTVGQSRGFFLKAIYNDEVISGLVVTMVGNRAWALYLANDYNYRKIMPNKLLLWKAIKIAREHGCKFVDFGSTQGTDSFDPKADSLDNLKSAYRPTIVNYPGYYDLVSRFYHGFRLAEQRLLPFALSNYFKLQRFSGLLKREQD
ncbi:lipid II:glycine glycyltransferase FemX [Desulfosarcina alkanivorans]|nr:peptidoglycan bridge formation glycyltransferase FemA/FemB family protein [Desulfosarcina alkanivorans]